MKTPQFLKFFQAYIVIGSIGMIVLCLKCTIKLKAFLIFNSSFTTPSFGHLCNKESLK